MCVCVCRGGLRIRMTGLQWLRQKVSFTFLNRKYFLLILSLSKLKADVFLGCFFFAESQNLFGG